MGLPPGWARGLAPAEGDGSGDELHIDDGLGATDMAPKGSDGADDEQAAARPRATATASGLKLLRQRPIMSVASGRAAPFICLATCDEDVL